MIVINRIIYIIFFVIASLLAAWMCQDNLWDFANYHYYNAFAFWHNRHEYDIAPGSVNTFFNPLMDLPLYFYIQHFNDHPHLIYALQGAWLGVLLCILYKLCGLFVTLNSLKNRLWALGICLLFVCGQATWSQIGSSTNEIQVAVIAAFAIYNITKMLQQPQNQTATKFCSCGFLLGIALGLKATVITACLSSGLALIVLYRHLKTPKYIIWFALSGLAGYVLIDGYFMYERWQLYGNPFFPFMNALFKSPYFPPLNYRDAYWLPDFSQIWQYPYKWNFAIEALSIGKLRDFRLAIYYTLLLSGGTYMLFPQRRRNFYRLHPAELYLWLFAALFYVIWLCLFSILRYLVLFELIGALLLGLTLRRIYQRQKFICAAISIVLLYLLTVNPLHYSAQPHFYVHKFLDIEQIQVPQDTLVEFYGLPQSVVTAEWAKLLNNNFYTVTHYANATNGLYSDVGEYGVFLRKRQELQRKYKNRRIIVYQKTEYLPEKEYKKYLNSIRKTEELCEPLRGKKFLHGVPTCDVFWHVTEYKRFQIPKLLKAVKNYKCRRLKNNLEFDYRICVPPELAYVLEQNNDEK